MSNVINLLEAIRGYEIEKYETEKEFKEELDRLVTVKYDGSFSTFMEKEVLNEDYGSLRSEVERLYFNQFCVNCFNFPSSLRGDCVAGFGDFPSLELGKSQRQRPSSLK